MHRAGQRCFELLALIGSPQLSIYLSGRQDVAVLFHHVNVFGYNSISIVMFVCFYCYLSFAVIFFLIYLFVTAKANCRKKV